MANWSDSGNFSFTTVPQNVTEDLLQGRETYSDHKRIWNIATGIICVEFVLAFALNAIVIGLLTRSKKKNRMSFFVLHLAISDFLMAVFYIFPVVVDRLLDAWLAGMVMCKLLKYLSLVVCYGSTYMLVVLSVDRLYAISRPLSSAKRDVLYRWLLVVTAWILAAFLGTYDLVYAEILTGIPTPEDVTPFCEIVYPQHMKKMFILLFAFTNVFVPAMAVGACYMAIVTLLWRRGRSGIPMSNHKSTGDRVSCASNSRLTSDSGGVIHKAKVKTIKMTFVVVSAFLVCWGPFTFYSVLIVHAVLPLNSAFFILMALAPLNSVANPIVFLLFNHRMLCERKRKHRQDNNVTSYSKTHTTYVYTKGL